MRRNENIVFLSKDHHFGLLHIWKIKQGIRRKVTLDRIVKYITFYWENNQKAHFEEEEQYLFSYLSDELIGKAIEEHKQIRILIEQIQKIGGIYLIKKYIDLLTQHIRYEERILFPYIEKNLSDKVLSEIGGKLTKEHHTEIESYADEFWQ